VLADPSLVGPATSPATTRRPRPRSRDCSTTSAGKTRGSWTLAVSGPPAGRRTTPCCSSRSPAL
jgi:hypothetical protein